MGPPANTILKGNLVTGTKPLTATMNVGSRSTDNYHGLISNGGLAERKYISKRLTERLKLVQEETQENFESPEKEVLDRDSSLPGLHLVELAAEQLMDDQGMSRQSSREFCGLGGVQLPDRLKIALKPTKKHSDVISGNTRYKSDATKGSVAKGSSQN
jgi:hypothetical protein